MNLTQVFVKRAKCDKGKTKQFFYDDELKGFMLEVRTNSRKTFFLKTTTPDGKRKSTIPPQKVKTTFLKSLFLPNM